MSRALHSTNCKHDFKHHFKNRTSWNFQRLKTRSHTHVLHNTIGRIHGFEHWNEEGVGLNVPVNERITNIIACCHTFNLWCISVWIYFQLTDSPGWCVKPSPCHTKYRTSPYGMNQDQGCDFAKQTKQLSSSSVLIHLAIANTWIVLSRSARNLTQPRTLGVCKHVSCAMVRVQSFMNTALILESNQYFRD